MTAINASTAAMLKKDAQSVNHSKEGNTVQSSAESTDNWQSRYHHWNTESFFRRKYCTEEVWGISKCGCLVGSQTNRVIPLGTSGRQNIRHLSLGSGRQQNPAPMSTIWTVAEGTCCSLIHKNHSSSAQQVLKIHNKWKSTLEGSPGHHTT